MVNCYNDYKACFGTKQLPARDDWAAVSSSLNRFFGEPILTLAGVVVGISYDPKGLLCENFRAADTSGCQGATFGGRFILWPYVAIADQSNSFSRNASGAGARPLWPARSIMRKTRSPLGLRLNDTTDVAPWYERVGAGNRRSDC
jgi:hypothetical protein